MLTEIFSESIFSLQEDAMSRPVTKLKKIREGQFLSMNDLAKLAGVSVQTVSIAEKGHKLSLGSIRKIALALKINPEKLI